MFAIACLTFSGFTALCMGMAKHYQQLRQRAASPGRLRLLRGLGSLLLAVSLWFAVCQPSWAIGLASWCGLISLSAFVLVALLPYQPRLAVPLAVVSGALGLVMSSF